MRCTPILRNVVPLLFVCLCAVAGVRAAERPNVVIILADDMGYGDVHALNPASKIPTPHLDRLAGEGMVFTDGHSPSAVCTPTRYALLTGRYAWRTRLKRGVLGGYSKPLLEPGRSTIGNLLSGAGYATTAVGKWHLGMELPLKGDDVSTRPWEGDPGIDFAGEITNSPVHHGFDHYFGVSASLDMAPYVWIRDTRFTQVPTIQQPAVKFPYFVRKGPRSTDFVIDEVLDRLADEAVATIHDAARGDKPFFLYLPMTAPHKPTQPHARFRGKTSLGEYGDFVHHVDSAVGRVLGAIDSAGVASKTLVVYTSDNGSYMHLQDESKTEDHVDKPGLQSFRPSRHRPNGVFRGTKADIFEAGHHVPLFVRWPGTVKAGTRCTETVCLTDLYATCAEIVGTKLGNDAAEDSVSLLPLLRGKPASRGAPVIHHSVGGMFAIRDGKWKLIAGNGSGGRAKPRGKPFAKPYQLFDMEADVEESNDVAAAHPDVVAKLTKQLEMIRSRGRSVDR